MKVCIGYQSALEYWRIRRALPDDRAMQRRNIALPNTIPTAKQVRSSGLSLPLHTILRDPDYRWRTKIITQHILSGKLPAGCFFTAKNELEVSSPEFCFLQMAGSLSLPGLIELGYELCGKYSLPVAAPITSDVKLPERGFFNRPPLTNVKKISAFIASMPGFKGQKKAVRALRYILEGSASPMETKLSVLLTLPYQLGGFGFLKPELNARVTPKKSDRGTTDKEFYICDLFWPDKEVAVEYDSNQFHTGSAHIADDSKKRNALKAMGIGVITITTQQIYDKNELALAARVIAKSLGKRLVYKNPGFAAAHNELRGILHIESDWPQ